MCGASLESGHRHVIDLEARRLMCTCRPCFLLFTHRGAAQGKLRSVSERYLRLPKVEVSDIPVGVAFFIREGDRVKAFYPSPAGATEANVSAEVWDEMVAAVPGIAAMEEQVEALLVSRNESWIVPVDACYELVGRIRRTWRGFDGGSEARREMDAFFSGLGAGMVQ